MPLPAPRILRLDGRSLTLGDFARVASGSRPPRVTIAASARRRMSAAEKVVLDVLRGDRAVYGVNTGFGRLAEVRIRPDQHRQLQRNLILSHSAGVGPLCTRAEVRGMILLRLNLLAQGHSGVSRRPADRLAFFLNADLCPDVPRHGSVGASGDLAPMAHVALAVIGEGTVRLAGKPMSSRTALRRLRLSPLLLAAREGLALINGVQASTALLALAVADCRRLLESADLTGALSALAMAARPESFDPRLAEVRHHPGQAESARRIARYLRSSGARLTPSSRVQDPYSVRCAAQVHGVGRDSLAVAVGVCECEMNAATDNPLVFAESREILAGGNFHGAPIGHTADHLAAVVTDLASISERRTALLMDPQFNRATPFLVPPHGEGLHSGMMMWQVTAASLVSEMKTLAHPASVDSIPTSMGQEDHVSMSMWAADKLRRIVERWLVVLSIEALGAWRALTIQDRLPRRGPLGELAQSIGKLHGTKLADRMLGPTVEEIGRLLMRDPSEE
ncbi:MAG: histidine ammonia-lyase [candidate division Zixibacteria bacterium]|nr:histidine ammonia-lyase [candidate division Zixibacteria bacterium]